MAGRTPKVATQPKLTVTCQGARSVLRIAPIAAALRFGSVRVKGRACSIAYDAGGALMGLRAMLVDRAGDYWAARTPGLLVGSGGRSVGRRLACRSRPAG